MILQFYVGKHGDAYEDAPQTIGFAATISAPHMHAHALEYLVDHLKPGARVLDVGCGSGVGVMPCCLSTLHRLTSLISEVPCRHPA